MKKIWRLLPLNQPTDPLWNMALDEVLLESPILARPTLRFYSWSKETLSIGYFQGISSVIQSQRCRERGLDVVRRITGGGQVRHGTDLTFSMILGNEETAFSSKASESYKEIHRLILKSLASDYPQLTMSSASRSLGPRRFSNCFDEPTCFDLMLDGKKVVGSSQRRKRKVWLHQTSIFLMGDMTLIASRICEGFKRDLEIEFDKSILTSQEIIQTNELIQKKYLKSNFSFLNPKQAAIFI